MKFNLIESINKQEIIKAVKEKFDAQNYPIEGPTYILPDGSFLDIAGTFDPKNSFEDFPCHAEVEGFLLDIGLSNQVVDVSGSPTLENLGAIRCNDLQDNNFIQLSKIKPTYEQYESLENWIYENASHRSELIVANPEFEQYKKYDPEDVEYILKRIKRYYASGTLYESNDNMKSLDIAKLCKQVNKEKYAFGGDCGVFALAMYNKLTSLGYNIEIIFCSNFYQAMNDDETEEDEFNYLLEGEPDIYHVAIRVNGDKIYDGEGLRTVEDLESFCYEWYRNSNPCISAYTIDDDNDYNRFEQIIRWNTNMQSHIEDFEEIIDKYLSNENLELTEAKKKKKRKSKNKLHGFGWFSSFCPDIGAGNEFFNSCMSADGGSVGVSTGGISNGGLSGGMGESLNPENDKYYRIEVLNEKDNLVGGLFRGLNDLINDLWDADDPLYDYINNPLSELEYKTYYPKDFLYTDAIFAYKENKYKELEETILDLKAELNSIGWDLDIKIINRPENIVYEDDQQIAYISSVKENTNIIKNKNGALNEEMENQELRYTVKRYGEWWWGIIDHTLNNGSGLMMRAGVNPDYNAPLDKGENKLLLFKSKELAQEHCDKLNKETLSENISIFERGDFNKYKISDEELEEVKNRSIIKEEFISGRYVWCNYSDVQGMNIYQLCRFIEDKYKEKYHESIKVNDIEDQSYDYSNKELPYIVRVEKIKEEDYDFWFVIHCTEEEAKDLLYDPTNECVKPEVEESVNNTQICSICGKEYDGYGNNAEPINDGRCCDECNLSKVIPARLGLMKESLEQVERFIDSDTSLTSSSGEVEFASGDVRGVDTIYLYKDGNQCYLKGYGHSFKNTYAWTPLTYVEIDQFDESDSQFFDTNKYDIINLTGLVNKYKEYFQTEDIFINECLTDVNEAFDLLNKLED